MIVRTVSDLKALLKKDERPRAYLIYGSEKYLCNTARTMLRALALKDSGEDAVFKIDGDKFDEQAFADSVETFSFFGGLRLTEVWDIPINKISDNAFESILSACEDLPDYSLLCVSIKHGEDVAKHKRYKSIVEHFEKHGCALNFDKQSTADLISYIIKTLKKSGKEITKPNAKFMIDYCSDDMLTLSNELAKLSGLDDVNIDEELIKKICIPTVEARIFDLSKAVLSGKPRTAVEIVDKLFYLRERPEVILATLARPFADMYRAKVAVSENVPVKEASNAFGYKAKNRAFIMENAYRDCSKYKTHTLAKALDILGSADLALKSSRLSNHIIIEKTVLELIHLFSSAGGRFVD